MKIIFSRKGFDTGKNSGGKPSPIINGKLKRLPIPECNSTRSHTTYDNLGLGNFVSDVTKARIHGSHHCHYDPMFENGQCAFGQRLGAEGHLRKEKVGVGDLFLFFGIYSIVNSKDKYHRIFGYLKIEKIIYLGENPLLSYQPTGFTIQHPHTIGTWDENNTLYVGPGKETDKPHKDLQLTKSGSDVCLWKVPSWLRNYSISHNRKISRWKSQTTIEVNTIGQEFVVDVGNDKQACNWCKKIIALI